jgi:hypothetical protein
MSLSVGAFLHLTILQLYPCYYCLHIILFSALAEYQSYVYSYLFFRTSTQTCCSKAGGEVEFFDEEC